PGDIPRGEPLPAEAAGDRGERDAGVRTRSGEDVEALFGNVASHEQDDRAVVFVARKAARTVDPAVDVDRVREDPDAGRAPRDPRFTRRRPARQHARGPANDRCRNRVLDRAPPGRAGPEVVALDMEDVRHATRAAP